MKSYWWKFLGILLVSFAVVMSFVVPLSPGIVSVDNSKLKPGLNQFTVNTYQDNLDLNTRLWLASPDGSFVLPAQIVALISPYQIKAQLIVPQEVPSNQFQLIINHEQHGTYALSDAFYYENAVLVPGLKNQAAQLIRQQDEKYFSFPYKTILYETIRNLNFHVTMWFALLFCMLLSVIKSVQLLYTNQAVLDRYAAEAAKTGLWFALLGLVSGSIWAKFTWGAWWVNDTKLNGAAISTLIYLAYLILRNSINEEQKRARISAVYNLFAFVMLIVFIQVLPRMTDSLHPGNGGNPAFSNYDLDNNLRLVFYPAVLGWILLAAWITQIRFRMGELSYKLNEND